MKEIKDDKGFTLQDVSVAIIVITIFISIIVTAYYNFYLSVTAKNRSAIATNCVIDVIEKVEIMNYEEVRNDTVNLMIQKLIEDRTIPDGYNITINISKYNETQGNTSKQDMIKILNIKVEYIVGNKKENLEVTRLITNK